MSRYEAAFYHLCISLVVFVGLAYLVLFVWFPDFFYTIDGGWEGMRIIIFVDLVLGPALTLVVFKEGKPGLKFDLTCIGVFQSICLIAGTYVVYSERPQFFIFYEEHFYSASADTFSRYGVETPDPSKFDSKTPAFVIATVPEDPIEEADFRRDVYQSGVPIWVYEPSFKAMENHMDTILDGAFSVESIRERDEDNVLDEWLAEQGGTAEDYAFYPVHSRYSSPFVAIEKSTKDFVGIIDVPAPLAKTE